LRGNTFVRNLRPFDKQKRDAPANDMSMTTAEARDAIVLIIVGPGTPNRRYCPLPSPDRCR
jgi:hypothetical protein